MFDPNLHPDQIEAMLNASGGMEAPGSGPAPMDPSMGQAPVDPSLGMDPSMGMPQDPAMSSPYPSTDPAWIAQQLQGLMQGQAVDAQAAADAFEQEQDSALMAALEQYGVLGGYDPTTDFAEGGSLDHLPDVPDEDPSDPTLGF